MKEKVNKGLLITVIVLVLVIGLLVFKLTRDTVSTNKDKNTTSDNNTQVIDKVEGAKDFNLKEAEQLLDKFGFYEDEFLLNITEKDIADIFYTIDRSDPLNSNT